MLGHVLCTLKIKAQIIAIKRIVEDIGGIECCITYQSMGIDHQPAARPKNDVLVMNVTMQRNGAMWR